MDSFYFESETIEELRKLTSPFTIPDPITGFLEYSIVCINHCKYDNKWIGIVTYKTDQN